GSLLVGGQGGQGGLGGQGSLQQGAGEGELGGVGLRGGEVPGGIGGGIVAGHPLRPQVVIHGVILSFRGSGSPRACPPRCRTAAPAGSRWRSPCRTRRGCRWRRLGVWRSSPRCPAWSWPPRPGPRSPG